MATYDGIYPWITSRLQDAAQGLDNSYFDLEIKSVLRETLGPFSVAYADLVADSDDKDRVDEAVGLRVAARLLGPLSTGGMGGLVSSSKTDDISRSFDGGEEEKAAWNAQAIEALEGCTFYVPPATGGRTLLAFNGPSRERCNEWR